MCSTSCPTVSIGDVSTLTLPTSDSFSFTLSTVSCVALSSFSVICCISASICDESYWKLFPIVTALGASFTASSKASSCSFIRWLALSTASAMPSLAASLTLFIASLTALPTAFPAFSIGAEIAFSIASPTFAAGASAAVFILLSCSPILFFITKSRDI